MKNRDRLVIYAVASVIAALCPALPACISDPPVACFYPSPVFWPLDACSAGQPAGVCGGNSYDPDNGPPYGYDNGITWHFWWAPTGSIVAYSGQTHSCAYVTFSSARKHRVSQWVTDDDDPPAESDEAKCDVWIFDISCSLSTNRIGGSATATLTMSHSPSNLPGSERLSVNAGGVVRVFDGANAVISGSDTEELWTLSGPSSLEVKGDCPGYATLTLQYTPDGQVYPGGQYNGNSASVTVVGVYKLQYCCNMTAQWVDVAGTTYVRKGDSIRFRAVPYPSGAWPSGEPVWGGSSGASGSGEEKEVTFNTLSSNPSDYKTVTADCTNTVTANVVVFDFEGTLEPVDDFSNRSLDRYGLEEWVRLDCTITPSGIAATMIGGLQWALSGVGSLSGHVVIDGKDTYDAGAEAGTPDLSLAVVSGPSWGRSKHYSKTVVAPSGEYMIKKPGSGTRHTVDTCSAGLLGYVYFEPRDVSFLKLMWRENTCTATATGFYSADNGKIHPVTEWRGLTGGNVSTGCLVVIADQIWSGERQPPYSDGQFHWPIPHEYKAEDGVAHFLATANHNLSADSAGKCTIQKEGAGPVSANAADDDSNW